jgi:nucleotide-binding universal stress UspA family protein
MPPNPDYSRAVVDFHQARRKADLQEIFARLRGESNKLLSYEEVRQKLKAFEGNTKRLEDIPLDAIIGSVGRYTDFTRDFLPRRDSDQTRWADVMKITTGSEGHNPVEVYQIGDAYFVLDGNHRVSVAREMGASHIQAYVTRVISRVPITPDIQPDQLIIKAEQVNFLDNTHLDILRPDADLSVTNPGQYPILEEHIEVHRFFMGLDYQRDIPYEEAVTHWYDQVYLPIIKIIRERGILDHFPQRTVTDLYLWIARHRADLETSLGWQLGTVAVADDLVYKYAQDFNKTISHLANRILDIILPAPLDSGPPVGHWRKKYVISRERGLLFDNILVALDKDTTQWFALDQALVIAKRERSQLRGLHIISKSEIKEEPYISALRDEFGKHCSKAGISGELAVEVGSVAREICERAHWADLVASNLAHPTGDKPFDRLESGFHTMIRRCPRPILAVPGIVTQLKHVLLAYTDSPKAEEALYIAAYLGCKWETQLTVLTIDQEGQKAVKIQESARRYLKMSHIQATYIHHEIGPRAEIILKTAKEHLADFILIGGYKANPVVEVVLGSVVDEILRYTKIPVLVCR